MSHSSKEILDNSKETVDNSNECFDNSEQIIDKDIFELHLRAAWKIGTRIQSAMLNLNNWKMI